MHACFPLKSSPFFLCTVPSPVRNLTMSYAQDLSCMLTWIAPQWMNGNFEYFGIRFYADVIDHTVSANTTDDRYDCKELEEGTHYEASIVAVNEHGAGKPSFINITTSIARKCPPFTKQTLHTDISIQASFLLTFKQETIAYCVCLTSDTY